MRGRTYKEVHKEEFQKIDGDDVYLTLALRTR